VKLNRRTKTAMMTRGFETKNIYSHLQTDRRTLSWMKPPPPAVGITMQQNAVGSSLKQIRAGVCFAMIGDESEDILQHSDRKSILPKQSFSLLISIGFYDVKKY